MLASVRVPRSRLCIKQRLYLSLVGFKINVNTLECGGVLVVLVMLTQPKYHSLIVQVANHLVNRNVGVPARDAFSWATMVLRLARVGLAKNCTYSSSRTVRKPPTHRGT